MAIYRIKAFTEGLDSTDTGIAAAGGLGTVAGATAYYRSGKKRVAGKAQGIIDKATQASEGARREVADIKGAMKTKRQGLRGTIDSIYDRVSGRTKDLGNRRRALDQGIRESETAARETAKKFRNLGYRKVGKNTLIGLGAGAAATAGAIGVRHIMGNNKEDGNI